MWEESQRDQLRERRDNILLKAQEDAQRKI